MYKLSEEIYKYKPHEHKLERVTEGDKRAELCDAALGQRFVRDGAIVIVFSAVYERTTGGYKRQSEMNEQERAT